MYIDIVNYSKRALLVAWLCTLSTTIVARELYSKEIALEGVSKIYIELRSHVEIRQGEQEFVRALGSKAALEAIDAKVDSSKLWLSMDENHYKKHAQQQPVQYVIQLQNIELVKLFGDHDAKLGDIRTETFTLETKGANEIQSSAINAKHIEIVSSGSSTLYLESLKSETAEFKCAGAGDTFISTIKTDALSLKAAGACEIEVTEPSYVKNLDISFAGASELAGLEITGETAEISAAGAASVDIGAFKKLDINSLGASDVRYKGDPEISKSVLGAGDIEKVF